MTAAQALGSGRRCKPLRRPSPLSDSFLPPKLWVSRFGGKGQQGCSASVSCPTRLLPLPLPAERIVTAAQALGKLTEALQALEEAESSLGQLLAAEPRNPQFRRRQALLYQDRSALYYDDTFPDLGDPAHGLESAKRYLDQAGELVRSDPNNSSARLSQAIALFYVSFCLREFNAQASVTMARDSVRIFDELIASGRTSYLVTSRRVRALHRLGEAQLKAGRVAEARQSAESALTAERQIAGRHAAEWQEHTVLVKVLLLDAETSAASGDFVHAESLLQQAHESAQSIARNRELTYLIPLAHTEQALGTFYVGRHRTAEARTYRCGLRFCFRQRLTMNTAHRLNANEWTKARCGRLRLRGCECISPSISGRSRAFRGAGNGD